ncbi:MAG: hypothetical protein MRERV_3c012 [Mycoplasmataceae bacterium RV_VA103A]|nr:MAG: hypothetical protein MRERV_3c012 [Mycoplasmataceae bacterium RV_VA103A]
MLNIQEYLNQITNKEKLTTLDLSKQNLSGEADLSEFTNLISIRAGGNQFTNCDWLSTIPEASRKKLKWLNFVDNQIKKVNWSELLTNFPNLVFINLENNPLSGENLKDLDSQQLDQLISLVKDERLKINSQTGTLLTDILKYAQQLKEENTELKRQLQAQVEIAPK